MHGRGQGRRCRHTGGALLCCHRPVGMERGVGWGGRGVRGGVEMMRAGMGAICVCFRCLFYVYTMSYSFHSHACINTCIHARQSHQNVHTYRSTLAASTWCMRTNTIPYKTKRIGLVKGGPALVVYVGNDWACVLMMCIHHVVVGDVDGFHVMHTHRIHNTTHYTPTYTPTYTPMHPSTLHPPPPTHQCSAYSPNAANTVRAYSS